MLTHELIQGTPEWHAHRASHFNASDAPAMMGCSPYKTRSELMHEMHTCLVPEFDAGTQRLFDEGHRFEALARPLAEAIIGEELYPVTGSEGRLSASFDGLTMNESTVFEHKMMNKELRACFQEIKTMAQNHRDTATAGKLLPLMYRVQTEQQLMVSSAERDLFMASKWEGDKLIEEQHCWYWPDEVLRKQIVDGWAQFAIDLAAYVPPPAAPVLVAAAQVTLPAVSVKLEGSIAIIDNLDLFGVALTAYIDKINRAPTTDQDFLDLKSVVATLEKAEAALDAAENTALASIASVNTMQSVVDTLRALAKQNRLMAEKLYKVENDRRKLEIIDGGKNAFTAHITTLNARLGKPYMPMIAADFNGVAKSLRTLASMQNAIDTELARVKIIASAEADRIQINMVTLAELGSSYKFLFADTSQIVLKANDDLRALVENRIATHKNAEAAKEEAQRERIRAEELARIESDRLAQAQKDEGSFDAALSMKNILRDRATRALGDAISVKTPLPLTLIQRLRRPVVRVNAEVALLAEAALEAATVIEEPCAANLQAVENAR